MIWRHLELNVVSQAVFGVLDLEREGQVPQDLNSKAWNTCCRQDLLLQRLLEPPSMKANRSAFDGSGPRTCGWRTSRASGPAGTPSSRPAAQPVVWPGGPRHARRHDVRAVPSPARPSSARPGASSGWGVRRLRT